MSRRPPQPAKLIGSPRRAVKFAEEQRFGSGFPSPIAMRVSRSLRR